jgi:hypothetical protein
VSHVSQPLLLGQRAEQKRALAVARSRKTRLSHAEKHFFNLFFFMDLALGQIQQLFTAMHIICPQLVLPFDPSLLICTRRKVPVIVPP